MVNQNKGGVYEPTPVANRKLSREIIRNQVIKKYGYHKVNQNMSETYKSLKEKFKEN